MNEPLLLPLGPRRPDLHPTAWVAPGAVVTGDVRIGADVSLWYAVVVRGDAERIEIGARSNLQDGSVLHADAGFPLVVGEGVSVGHRAVLHGAVIEDDVLVGMGAIVMNGARVGAGSIIGAGACVPQGMQVPPGSLVLGLPAKVRGETSEEQRAEVRANAETYLALAARHRAAQPR